jgi:hypothetical protein
MEAILERRDLRRVDACLAMGPSVHPFVAAIDQGHGRADESGA